MVMHWYTVSMEKPKLSKWVMPWLGPGQPPRHSLPLMVHGRPEPVLAQGDGFSFSTVATMSAAGRRRERQTQGLVGNDGREVVSITGGRSETRQLGVQRTTPHGAHAVGGEGSGAKAPQRASVRCSDHALAPGPHRAPRVISL